MAKVTKTFQITLEQPVGVPELTPDRILIQNMQAGTSEEIREVHPQLAALEAGKMYVLRISVKQAESAAAMLDGWKEYLRARDIAIMCVFEGMDFVGSLPALSVEDWRDMLKSRDDKKSQESTTDDDPLGSPMDDPYSSIETCDGEFGFL